MSKRAGPGRPELSSKEKLTPFALRMRPSVHKLVKYHSGRKKVTPTVAYRYLVEFALSRGAFDDFDSWLRGVGRGYQYPDKESSLIDVVEA
jgi:hypothetical protein